MDSARHRKHNQPPPADLFRGEFSAVHRHRAAVAAKRGLDVLVSVVVLILCLPGLAVVAVLVKLSSRGPVLFRQERIGRDGRPFVMYKFRTMREGASAVCRDSLPPNEVCGPVFKLRRDPRVTPIGRVLRVSSLDELPQLWNVLRGDMSLVGPRPPLPTEVLLYNPLHRRRLSVPPGLTGPWQIAGRSEVDFETWMRMDLQYIDDWSLLTDLRILARTIPAVLSGRGAW